MTKRASAPILLALALPLGGLLAACDEEGGRADFSETAGPPPFVCPLPEPTEEDPGALPVADPARVAEPPALGRGCDVQSKALQRLNRAEYNNTARDLMGVDLRPADRFPSDSSDEGFDNIAGIQTVSPLLVEKYFDAARELVDAALHDGTPEPTRHVMEAETYLGGDESEGFARLDNGARYVEFPVDWEGDYAIRVMAWGEQAGGEVVRMALELSSEGAEPISLGQYDVAATSEAPALFEVTRHLVPGMQRVRIEFLNDFYRAEDRGQPQLNRNLVVDFVELEGPFNPAPAAEVPAARAAILTCDAEEIGEEACGREILTRMLRRAHRRPPTGSEVDRYLGFLHLAATDGQRFEDGLRLALRALLLSPEFLFRVERDPDLTSDELHRVGDHELASRLSYFLWSSQPDDRLLDLADQGALHDPVVLEGEVRRMLQSRKARSLTDNLAGQWLGTRLVEDVQLDGNEFPRFTPTLKASARCETEMLFNDVLRTGGTIEDLILSDHTFVNRPLARHYGMEDVVIEEAEEGHPDGNFVRVSLEGTERKGVLTHASVLAINSHPNRTSPVRRGKWVLEQLMCAPPPPPPPNVEGLVEVDTDAQTLREQLEAHRADPFCASCHQLMDPIGLGLENFDASGRYRTLDNGQPIDSASELFGATPFHGAIELAENLATYPEVSRCVMEKTLTFATGQTLESYGDDACLIDSLATAFDQAGHRLEDALVLVTQSTAFRMRRADPLADAEAEAQVAALAVTTSEENEP